MAKTHWRSSRPDRLTQFGFRPAEVLEAVETGIKEPSWRKRIAAIHVKDRPWLGEGKVDMPGFMRAIADIGYRGWVDLETSNPTTNVEADMRKNLEYLRSLLA